MRHTLKNIPDFLIQLRAGVRSKKFWRPRANVNFFVSLIGLGILLLLIWYLSFIEDFSSQVALTLLYSIIPLSLFISPTRDPSGYRKTRWGICGITLFLFFALVLTLADKHDQPVLGLNVIALTASLPFIIFCWIIARIKRLLLVAIFPSGLLAMVYFIFGFLPDEARLNNALLPLPLLLLFIAVWSVGAWILLDLTEQMNNRPTWGPGLESLSMTYLFAPMIFLAIWVPQQLTEGDTWSTVLGTLLSVILGSVISTPVGQFLLDLGDLPSNPRHASNIGEHR